MRAHFGTVICVLLIAFLTGLMSAEIKQCYSCGGEQPVGKDACGSMTKLDCKRPASAAANASVGTAAPGAPGASADPVTSAPAAGGADAAAQAAKLKLMKREDAANASTASKPSDSKPAQTDFECLKIIGNGSVWKGCGKCSDYVGKEKIGKGEECFSCTDKDLCNLSIRINSIAWIPLLTAAISVGVGY